MREGGRKVVKGVLGRRSRFCELQELSVVTMGAIGIDERRCTESDRGTRSLFRNLKRAATRYTRTTVR